MDVLGDLWNWLDDNSRQLGALAAIAFGVSSAFVAILAYRLSRWATYGARPMVLVTSLGTDAPRDGARTFATFQGEVWNRRKYAITPKIIFARLHAVDAKDLLARDERDFDGWFLDGSGWFYMQVDGEIKADEKASFGGRFPAEILGHVEPPSIKVGYFDPMSGRNHVARNQVSNSYAWARHQAKGQLRKLWRRIIQRKPRAATVAEAG